MSRPSRVLLALVLCAGTRPAAAVTSCSGGNINLNLGAYDSYSATVVDSSATLLVTCTRDGGPKKETITVGLGPSFTSGAIAVRQARLTSGTDVLAYNLYREASRVSIWGETAGVDAVSQDITLPNNSSITLTFNIFARIDALQDVRAGEYTDQVTITVTF